MIQYPHFFSSKGKIVTPNQIQIEYHLSEIMVLLFQFQRKVLNKFTHHKPTENHSRVSSSSKRMGHQRFQLSFSSLDCTSTSYFLKYPGLSQFFPLFILLCLIYEPLHQLNYLQFHSLISHDIIPNSLNSPVIYLLAIYTDNLIPKHRLSCNFMNKFLKKTDSLPPNNRS